MCHPDHPNLLKLFLLHIEKAKKQTVFSLNEDVTQIENDIWPSCGPGPHLPHSSGSGKGHMGHTLQATTHTQTSVMCVGQIWHITTNAIVTLQIAYLPGPYLAQIN